MPVLILLAVVVGLVTLVALTSRDPVVFTVAPAVVRPGDQLVVEGRYLGQARGAIWIAGVEVPASSVSLWSDERIEFTVPRGSDSGLLFVDTDGGRSDGILLQVESSVPRSGDASFRPGTPQISSLLQTEAEIGNILMIEGENFGPHRRTSRVLFSSSTDSGTAAPEPAAVSYPVWTDDRIHVRIPSGAQSGFVTVDTAWGRSNPMRLRILRPAGQLTRTDRTEIAVRYGARVGHPLRADGEWGTPGAYDVVVWLPELRSEFSQSNIRYLEPPLGAMVRVAGAAVTAYRYEAVDAEFSADSRRTVVADRYGLQAEIDPARVSPVYEGESGFFEYYTRATAELPAGMTEFTDIAAAVRRNRASPYLIARAAYDWVIGHMDPALYAPERGAAAGMSQAYGDDFTYSTMLVTLLRAARIPSRIVGGVLVSGSGDVYPHFWAEFFVPAVGWVPVDPFLGDGAFPARFAEPDAPSDFYFGGIDSQRLAFHHGFAENGPGQRDGFQIAAQDPFSAQRSYVEVGPAIQDVEVEWYEPRLISNRPWPDAP